MAIDILPHGRRASLEIVEMPFKGQDCEICGLVCTDMTPQADFESHMVRCVDQRAEENKKMVALGYKQTSKGWVMK